MPKVEGSFWPSFNDHGERKQKFKDPLNDVSTICYGGHPWCQLKKFWFPSSHTSQPIVMLRNVARVARPLAVRSLAPAVSYFPYLTLFFFFGAVERTNSLSCLICRWPVSNVVIAWWRRNTHWPESNCTSALYAFSSHCFWAHIVFFETRLHLHFWFLWLFLDA